MSETRKYGELFVVPFVITFAWMYGTNFFIHWKSLIFDFWNSSSFDLGSFLLFVIVALLIPLCFVIGFLELREDVSKGVLYSDKLSQNIALFSFLAGFLTFIIFFS